MPDKQTLRRVRKDQREGKSPGTQAGEFIRETIDHIREGKHGARSTRQAIAIGLSKARRAGVKVPPPKKGSVSKETREHAERDAAAGEHPHPASRTRSRATTKALRRESHTAASPDALSRHAHRAALERTPKQRSQAARKAARTKGPRVRSQAARKAAKTRARHRSAG